MEKTATILLCCVLAATLIPATVSLPIAEDGQDESTTVAISGTESSSGQSVEPTTTRQTPVEPVESSTSTEAPLETTSVEPVESTTYTLVTIEPVVATTDTYTTIEPVESTTYTLVTVEPVVGTADTFTTTNGPIESTTDTSTTVEPVESTTYTSAVTPVTTEESITSETTGMDTNGTGAEIAETTTTAEALEPEVSVPDEANNSTTPEEVVKDKLSEQIRKILRHYQGPDPMGFPGAPIPDPLKIPAMKKNFGLADMTFFNMTVHGLSKFKVEHVKTDLKNMQVYVLLKIQRMYVLGNYTLKSWFGRPAAGPFNVTLIDVDAEAAAELVPDEDGNLQANETEMDMRFRDCELDFKNLGFTATLFQGIISSVGSVMFDGIKPFIITEVNTNLKADVNAQVKAITSKMPKIKVPVPDLAINEGRQYVRRMGYDPYRLADRNVKEGPFNFTVSELTIVGMSDFRRVGDIGLQVRGPVLQLSVHVITGVVTGSLRWRYQLGLTKMFGRAGESNFSAEHIQVRAVVNQTLDIRNKPVLDRLDIEVGRIAVQMDRKEPLDYVIEIAVNSLPSLLRHIIVDALEEPIKMKVQTILDDVQLERMVEERLPELDRLAAGESVSST